MNGYVYEGRGAGGCIDGFEEHGSPVLVEEFGCGVEVVVCSRVGAADDHDGVAGGVGGVVDAVVVDGGLEEMGVGFEPVVASLALEWLRDAMMLRWLTIWGC